MLAALSPASVQIPTAVVLAALGAVFVALTLLIASALGAFKKSQTEADQVLRRLEVFSVAERVPTRIATEEQVARLLANYENNQGETAGKRLHELVRAERLNRMLESDPRTGILQLKVLKAGGSQRITRNLIFGSKIRHSGSAIVEYLLFDKTGLLRSSEMFYYHTGFQKMDNTRSVKN